MLSLHGCGGLMSLVHLWTFLPYITSSIGHRHFYSTVCIKESPKRTVPSFLLIIRSLSFINPRYKYGKNWWFFLFFQMQRYILFLKRWKNYHNKVVSIDKSRARPEVSPLVCLVYWRWWWVGLWLAEEGVDDLELFWGEDFGFFRQMDRWWFGAFSSHFEYSLSPLLGAKAERTQSEGRANPKWK